MQGNFTEEFPDFPADTMPAIPEGWADVSWHNDTCPSFETRNGLTVFVDYADASLREFPEAPRFSIQQTFSRDDMMASDDFDAILAFVAAHVHVTRPDLITDATLAKAAKVGDLDSALQYPMLEGHIIDGGVASLCFSDCRSGFPSEESWPKADEATRLEWLKAWRKTETLYSSHGEG